MTSWFFSNGNNAQSVIETTTGTSRGWIVIGSYLGDTTNIPPMGMASTIHGTVLMVRIIL